MKNIYTLLLIAVTFNCLGQETLYKNYKVTNFIDFLNDGIYKYNYDTLTDAQKQKVKFLMKEKCLAYDDLSEESKAKIDAKFELVVNKVLPKIKLRDCSGNIIIIDDSNVNNTSVKKLVGMTENLRANTFGDSEKNDVSYKAGLLFEKNKLYVNLWPFIENDNKKNDNKDNDNKDNDKQSDSGIKKTIKKIEKEDKDLVKYDESLTKEDKNLNDEKDTSEILFYEIPDDHTAKFDFTEITLTAITLPVKYRFKTNRQTLDTSNEENIREINDNTEEFSSSINIAFFGGYSWGRSNFTHRKKIGNKTTTFKHTLGAFLGSSAIELSSINTNITLGQPQSDREGTFGALSYGLGYVFSWNKISVGVFSGIDKGIGRVSESWIYDGDIWLGFGVGYDLFKL